MPFSQPLATVGRPARLIPVVLLPVVCGIAVAAGASDDCTPGELLRLVASDGGVDHEFGHAVAVQAGLAVVGAPDADLMGDNAGEVYVFRRDGQGEWAESVVLTPPRAGADQLFGTSVAIADNAIVVGAPEIGSGSGRVYVFRHSGVDWMLEAELDAGLSNDGAWLGYSVALDGDTLIAGAPSGGCGTSGTCTGAAYLFRRGGQSWGLEASFLPHDLPEPDDIRFGTSVALGDGVAVVGARGATPNGEDSGAAYVYGESGGWGFDQKLQASDGAPLDNFGVSVAVDRGVIAVGAWQLFGDGFTPGKVYVYRFNGSGWSDERRLLAHDADEDDRFGVDVSLRGDRLIVGAYGDDETANFAGAAYVFDFDGAGWVERAKLTAAGGRAGDALGEAVAFDGESILVGAYSADDLAEQSGAAVLFGCPAADTDGDGLLDSWESEGGGIDVNGDGTVDLDLYALGARHDSKDLFVEIDLMQGAPFDAASIDDVRSAFANAPVTNPDGTEGIRLHADTDTMDTIQFAEYWDDDFIAFDIAKDLAFGTASDRASGNSEHILAARKLAYRYCIFANRMIDDSLGIAERPGNDFYVTLGSISQARVTERRPLRWWVAHVFMHELGHNLGLTHGGGFDIDGDDPNDTTYVANYKPNYISCMNYAFDFFRWTDADGEAVPLDVNFSTEALIPLSETNLSEPVGIPTDEYANVLVPYGYAETDGTRKIGWGVLDDPDGIDWNGDVDWDDTGVAQDITFYGDQRPQHGAPTPGDTLNGFNDWAIIELAIGTDGDFADYTHGTVNYDEISAEVLDWHADHVPPPPVGCRVDLNEDRVVDTRDVLRFLDLWARRLGAADFNLDGGIDTRDVIAFLNDWAAGC